MPAQTSSEAIAGWLGYVHVGRKRTSRASPTNSTNHKYQMSMAIRPEDLPSDPARLIAMVLSLDAENDRLQAVIGTFKDMVFGSRSEKLAAVVANQLALDLADLATDVTLPAAANDDHVPSQAAGTIGKPHKKAQRNIGALPKHLPRCEQVIEPATTACPCCQGRLRKIGRDVSEVLDVIPAIHAGAPHDPPQICLPGL